MSLYSLVLEVQRFKKKEWNWRKGKNDFGYEYKTRKSETVDKERGTDINEG
jgi:hypothetical protein